MEVTQNGSFNGLFIVLPLCREVPALSIYKSHLRKNQHNKKKTNKNQDIFFLIRYPVSYISVSIIKALRVSEISL